jgi:uncharacterized membrane protein
MTGRILLAAIFLISGCLHFLAPDVYLRIMPPGCPHTDSSSTSAAQPSY